MNGTYPVDLNFEYGDGARSRGLGVAGIFFPVKVLLALPHMIVLYFLQLVANIAAWIGFWIIAFTGELPPGMARLLHQVLGWQMRVYGWIAGATDEYPPFAMEAPDYPVGVTITEPTLQRNRGLAVAGILWFVKVVLLIPHAIVLAFVGLAASIAGWVAFWAIAFTGVYPESIFYFVLGTMRWGMRMSAWIWSLTDEYPPFAISS